VSANRQRYDAIQSELRALIPAMNWGSQEASMQFRKLWDESERIKNRHGGMPPAEDFSPDGQTKPEGLASSERTRAVGRADNAGKPAGAKGLNCGPATRGTAGQI